MTEAFWGLFDGEEQARVAQLIDRVGLPTDAEYDVDDYVTFDFSISYDFEENSFVQLAVRNIFDQDPPRVLGSSANVDLFNHDLIGRFATLRVTKRF